MSILNTITNTKTVADSFVNDQLKWRRERIEDLTKNVSSKSQQAEKLQTVIQKNLKYMEVMAQCIAELITFEYKDRDISKSAKNIIKMNNDQIDQLKKFIDNNFKDKK